MTEYVEKLTECTILFLLVILRDGKRHPFIATPITVSIIVGSILGCSDYSDYLDSSDYSDCSD